MKPLGRVLDVAELESAEGTRARVTVDVLEAWLAGGAELEIVVPLRLTCARCDGGGCDACGRSGAIRVERDADARTIQVTLSAAVAANDENAAERARRALRLVRPLGDHGGPNHLLIELRAATAPSAFCRRLPDAVSRRGVSLWAILLVALLLAGAIALVRSAL